MGLCQQKQYMQMDNYKPKDDFNFSQSIKKMNEKQLNDERKFQESIKKMNQKKIQQDKKFQQSLRKMQEKKEIENQKFLETLKKFQQKRKLQPNQTPMAKVLYAYMRHYGGNPDYRPEIGKFIQENYNDSYQSSTYKLNQKTPLLTTKHSVIDRLKKAHENSLISDHQRFIKADETKRTIQYTWTIRNQLTNHRTLYECEASFDEKMRFLKVTMRQTDTYNYRPPPKQPQKTAPKQPQKTATKYAWQTKSNDYYNAPSTDWGAYYNAQIKRSNQQFRQNMNKQAQQWNNYVQQKNARGW